MAVDMFLDMSKRVIWHDYRLQGTADPQTADYIVNVDKSITLHHAIARIGNYAKGQQSAVTLSILCHGFEKEYDSASESVCTTVGGYGLQLCKENLLHNNATVMSGLMGYLERIIIYACAAADTHPDLVGTNWDGHRLMQMIACYSGATVYAADVTQYYHYITNRYANACSAIINFGGWEGNVWRFPADGSAGSIVESDPITAQP